MAPEERQMLRDILVVFRRAASVPALRSDTEFNRLASQEAADQAVPLAAKVVGGIKNLNPTSENFLGLQSLQKFLTNRNMEANAQQVVNVITSGDPQAIKQLKELRRLSLTQKQFLNGLGHLVSRGAVAGVEQAVAEPNAAPGQQPN